MNRRRLTIEAWRDAILTAAGNLDCGRIRGPSINPADPLERGRTVYSRISRLSLNPLLALFDFPDANLTAGQRVETTTPLQKLFVMNSPFMLRQAEAVATRLTTEVGAAGGTDRDFIARAYWLLYDRPVTEAELRLGLEFLSSDANSRSRRQEYAHVLLASNEMLFLD
jgi:hypothetical protein